MNHPRVNSLLMGCLVPLVAALPLAALVQPEDTAIRELSFRHPDLYIASSYLPATDAEASRAATGLASLGVTPTGAYLDARSGRWGTLMMSQPLLPGDGVGNQLEWPGLQAPGSPAEYQQSAWTAFTGYLSEHMSQLGIDVEELQQPGVVTVRRGGDLVQIYAPRIVRGLRPS